MRVARKKHLAQKRNVSHQHSPEMVASLKSWLLAARPQSVNFWWALMKSTNGPNALR
jgi:hypothetical protein